MRLPLELLINAKNHSGMLQALRAFGLLTKIAPHGSGIRRSDLRKALMGSYGMSGATADRTIHAVLERYGRDGRTTYLAWVDAGYIRARAVQKVVRELKMTRLGWVRFTDSDISTLQKFKDANTEYLGTGGNRDSRGGSSISHDGLQRILGITAQTQLRRFKRRGVRVQHNVAQAIVGDDKAKLLVRYFGRTRPELGKNIVWRRNTYFSTAQATSYLQQRPKEVRGMYVKYYAMLHPEYGDRSIRQSFEQGDFTSYEAFLLIDSVISTGADLDIFIRLIPDPRTGELIGLYERHVGDRDMAS